VRPRTRCIPKSALQHKEHYRGETREGSEIVVMRSGHLGLRARLDDAAQDRQHKGLSDAADPPHICRDAVVAAHSGAAVRPAVHANSLLAQCTENSVMGSSTPAERQAEW